MLLFNGYQAVAQGVKKSWEQWCWLHILNVFKVTAYLVVAKSVSFILCEFHCHKNKLKVSSPANQTNAPKVKRTGSRTGSEPGSEPGRWEGWVSLAGRGALPHKGLHYSRARQSGRPHAISSGIQYEKVTTTNVRLKECSSKYKHIFLILAELIR